MIRVAVGPEDFDAGALLDELGRTGGGGIANFIGIVRGEGDLVELRLDHYPGMTERVLTELAEQATSRWDLLGATIVHRIGPLVPGDRIVLVATAAHHRAAALEGCAFLIDQLKTEAPFWKHERFAGGEGRWVEARVTDEAAAERWTAGAPSS